MKPMEYKCATLFSESAGDLIYNLRSISNKKIQPALPFSASEMTKKRGKSLLFPLFKIN